MPRPVWRHQIAERRDFTRRPARRGSPLSVWPNPNTCSFSNISDLYQTLEKPTVVPALKDKAVAK